MILFYRIISELWLMKTCKEAFVAQLNLLFWFLQGETEKIIKILSEYSLFLARNRKR
jgi:hypothetical protein